MKYIKELKFRFLLIVICWLSTCMISYLYKEILLFKVLQTIAYENERSLILANFMYTNIMELFHTYLNVVFFIGKQMIYIYSFYHFICFLMPGLYYYEYKILNNFYRIVLLCIFVSSCFLNRYLSIFIEYFFACFHKNLVHYCIDIKFDGKISEYLCFFIDIYYFLVLQLIIFFILIVFLKYFRIHKNSLYYFRRFFYFFFLLISTFLTPPELFYQIVVYFILILFFESNVFGQLLVKNF